MTALRSGTAQAVDHLKQTKSELMQGLLRQAGLVARTSMPVMIEGETGTGKEVLASLVHQSSNRSAGNFVAVNCAAVPAELAEAEFFGHKKGAFTGASAQREGYFKAADGGTLFLDEVGELSLPLQAKLLRALQEKKILAVGSDKEVPVDVRVVAATKRNLADMVRNGTFREDLYYRLNVVSVNMPPLRERPEDIAPLAAYFLSKHIADHGLPETLHFSKKTVEAMCQYNWPGNIRQMSNVIASATIKAMSAQRDMIGPEDLALPDKSVRASTVRATSDFKVAHGVKAPAVIDRRLLPQAELDMLMVSAPSAAIIFNLACKVMSSLSLKSFTATTLRAAPHKLSLAAIAKEHEVPVRAVKESMHVARQAMMYHLGRENPELLTSPILRKRVYQEAEEDSARYDYFDERRLAALEGDEQLEIASLLLNNRMYHQVGWGLTIPEGGLQKAFDGEASLNATVKYFTFLKGFRDFRQKAHLQKMLDEACPVAALEHH